MATIDLRAYIGDEFITMKEYPNLIYNGEKITLINNDLQSYMVYIGTDDDTAFGPCRSGSMIKTGRGLLRGSGRHCTIFVVDKRYKRMNKEIDVISKRYCVENGIYKTVSFHIEIEADYKLNCLCNSNGRYPYIENLIENTAKGCALYINDIERHIADQCQLLFSEFINREIRNQGENINSFFALSSLITNIKNGSFNLKKLLSTAISKKLINVNVEINSLNIVIPDDDKIEKEENAIQQTYRDIDIQTIKDEYEQKRKMLEIIMELKTKWIQTEIMRPEKELEAKARIISEAFAAGASSAMIKEAISQISSQPNDIATLALIDKLKDM